MTNVTPFYSEIVNPDNKVPKEVLKAFIQTNKAFRSIMESHGYTTKALLSGEKKVSTVVDLPTYKHLPEEFLRLDSAEKMEFIKSVCLQNTEYGSARETERWIQKRNKYISDLAGDTFRLLKDHLHVKMPEKFNHTHIEDIEWLLDFMNMRWFHDDQEKLYHCIFLKSIFMLHIIHSTVDLDSLPKVQNAIRKEIEWHPCISIAAKDISGTTLKIAYTPPNGNKPKFATIVFGEKDINAIFDKLARKPNYMSPEMLNDLCRMNVNFEDEDLNYEARVWLLQELSKIVFWTNATECEMSTKIGHVSIVDKQMLHSIGCSIKEVNIRDIHNLQITGAINSDIPHIRWVESFELMCTDDRVNWNKEGTGRREIYKVERLQQAFSRLTTGGFGVLKPGQVKFALQDFAKKEGIKDSPEELLELLVWDKKFLIPVNMLHGKALCYRVRWIYRPESKDLNTTILEDLDIYDSRVRGRLLREFSQAKTK